MINIFDVVIIGGGLGGLTLSIQMADLGWQVLLIEQKNYPMHRVCGEYVAKEAWGFLNRIGIDANALQLPIIDKLKVSAVNGEFLTSTLTSGGRGISRFLLDDLLYQKAIEKGVQVITNTKVLGVQQIAKRWEIETKENIFKSKSVIGAFGKRSNLDKFFRRKYLEENLKNTRLKNFVGVKYHLKGDLPSDIIELHNFSGGYCGISKIENDLICMCFLAKGSYLKDAHSLEEMEQKYLSRNPFLNKYLKYERVWDKPLSIAKVDFSHKSISENTIPMLGDAAGLIAPLCGNGMTMAMQASVFLTPLMDSYLKEEISWEQMTDIYHKTWQSTFGKRLFTGRIIQRFFGNSLTTNLLIKLLNNSSTLTKTLIKSTHGEVF
ncbi:NAD(P)/FAD-dependent oxidoreductase [Flammeovirga kamogawensis]|uniref:FAD-dependent monooxygenase n=1 Tax=Flammeovirga kamogawensis TaxID=373891 RepID=A0ABX8H2V5_9BACT|nr:FAD-dependent monooxygenase [Flammeovirga kamogawensis]MBB6460182.1 flavin-dependent dehydrogenase [Flammeovirga kamogawensis]QWG09994.1 FAD-dependent monooxygenase [Flammeovirga kamogawensis]TRX65502.1 FAD-binding protein [Flammeovirga kamogawensis]